jgi:hypothetical protein
MKVPWPPCVTTIVARRISASWSALAKTTTLAAGAADAIEALVADHRSASPAAA